MSAMNTNFIHWTTRTMQKHKNSSLVKIQAHCGNTTETLGARNPQT